MPEMLIGKVSHFFSRPVVAGIDLSGKLQVGDRIHIKGHTTDLEMQVQSMQIDNTAVQQADSGQSVGIKLTDKVRAGDSVFKIT